MGPLSGSVSHVFRGGGEIFPGVLACCVTACFLGPLPPTFFKYTLQGCCFPAGPDKPV